MTVEEIPRLDQLRADGVLAVVDLHFARAMARLGGSEDPLVLLGAAMASRAPRHGHVCVELSRAASTVRQERTQCPFALQLERALTDGPHDRSRSLCCCASCRLSEQTLTPIQSLQPQARNRTRPACSAPHWDGPCSSRLATCSRSLPGFPPVRKRPSSLWFTKDRRRSATGWSPKRIPRDSS